MKALRKYLDDLHAKFAKGGPWEKFYPLYEATDTFLYTPGEVTRGPSHVRDAMDLKRMMSTVYVALIPCIVMAMYNTGLQANQALEQMGLDAAAGWRGGVIDALGAGFSPGSIPACLLHGALYFVPVYAVSVAAGGAWEALFACVRRHDINEGFLITSILFPLTLPPTVPLWQVAVGISFGVVIGKEVFGGVGKNFLNPALTARAFLYFAYPAQMSGDRIWVAADGYTAATSLGALATAPETEGMAAITDGLQITWSEAFLGTIPGSMGETSTLCCLLGAFVLIVTGVGSWRTMAGVLVGALGSAALFNLAAAGSDNAMFQMPPHWHLVVGGLAFGLVFMATDPVSSAMTFTGMWFYGLLIGVMTTLIRVINPGYPEGIMLAILFGNVFAPLFDYCVVQANIRRRRARSAG